MNNIALSRIFSVLGLTTLGVFASLTSASAEVSSAELTLTGEDYLQGVLATAESSLQPVPGTVETSASVLTRSIPTLPQENRVIAEPEEATVAQTTIRPGRATRSGPSYLGVGLNLGIGDGTSLADTAFAINGKVGLTPTLSVRPSVIIGTDDTAFVIPLTYDFVPRQEDPFGTNLPFAPYIGAGIILVTDQVNNFGVAVTGGIDVPLSNEFTANAGVNVGFLENSTEVGVLFGVGYTFPR